MLFSPSSSRSRFSFWVENKKELRNQCFPKGKIRKPGPREMMGNTHGFFWSFRLHPLPPCHAHSPSIPKYVSLDLIWSQAWGCEGCGKAIREESLNSSKCLSVLQKQRLRHHRVPLPVPGADSAGCLPFSLFPWVCCCFPLGPGRWSHPSTDTILLLSYLALSCAFEFLLPTDDAQFYISRLTSCLGFSLINATSHWYHHLHGLQVSPT